METSQSVTEHPPETCTSQKDKKEEGGVRTQLSYFLSMENMRIIKTAPLPLSLFSLFLSHFCISSKWPTEVIELLRWALKAKLVWAGGSHFYLYWSLNWSFCDSMKCHCHWPNERSLDAHHRPLKCSWINGAPVNVSSCRYLFGQQGSNQTATSGIKKQSQWGSAINCSTLTFH